MRLLEVTNDFPPTLGGIETYLYSLLTQWDPSEVAVFTRRRPGDQEVDGRVPFPVFRDDARFLFNSRRVQRKVIQLAREREADVVHFATPLPLALMGPGLRRQGIPYAVTINGSEFTMPAGLPGGRSLLRKALSSASTILPYAPFLEGQVRRVLPAHQGIKAVAPGVDLNRFGPDLKPSFHSPRGGPVVVFVGRLVERKGAVTLVQAFRDVLRLFPDAHLLICGDGPDKKRIETICREWGITESVTLTGGVQWDRVPGYMKSATVFAQPVMDRFGGRETEGFGIVFLEAAAAGVPTVGGNVGGIPDAISEGETGFLVDGRRPEETSRRIIELLSNPALARKMGEAGRARVEERFTWARFYQDFRRALEETV